MTQLAQPERLEGYEPFFGLNKAPFSLAPDPRFLFASASHSAALAQVGYAIERREPLVVVTGEIGTGKTLLCRTMLQRLPLKTFLSVIDDPLLGPDDLLKQVLEDFGVISKDRARLTEASRHELVQTLHAFLASLSKIQAHAVVMIDEAQHLDPEVLEQIRLLSNVGDVRGTLLQIILVGQTALEPLLSRPELRQLQQRVSRRFALEPLNRDEVEQYITHRLALARDAGPSSSAGEPAQAPSAPTPGVEFTPEAIEAVSLLSAGVPRVINLLCDRALEQAYAFRLRTVDPELVHAAAGALRIHAPGATPTPDMPGVAAPGGHDGAAAPPAAVTLFEPETPAPVQSSDDSNGSVVFGAHRAPASPRMGRYFVLAACAVLAGLAVLFVVQSFQLPRADTPASAAVSPTPAAPTAAERPVQAPAAATAAPAAATAAPAAATASPAPALPADTATLPQSAARVPAPPTAAPATGERFDIVVASFRTDARATTVAAEVAALGLPVRRRTTDAWQQVLAGPFASRAQAEDAQQRIHRAGLTGTQIVPAAQ